MTDVHGLEDLLKGFEDLTALALKAKADGWKVGLGDLTELWTLLTDLKSLVGDVPDLATEAGAATVADWQALGSRAVADVVALLKALVA